MKAALTSAVEAVQPSVTELLRSLVRCPSVTSDGKANQRALDTLAGYLRQAGLHVDWWYSPTGVPTMRARIDGGSPGPNILLQGHIDVVPADAGWQRDPFGAIVEDGHLHGRGSCDMKAGLASFAGVLRALQESGGLAHGSVTLLADADEETGSDHGLIPYIAEHGLDHYDWAICGEPTDLQPYLGNRGLLWMKVIVGGVAAHAGLPSAGLNPIPVATQMVDRLRTAAGQSPVTVTTFHAGTVANSIAAKAEFTLDRRLLPGESATAAVDLISSIVNETAAGHPKFPVTIQTIKSWPPCLIDKDSALAATALDIAEEVLGAASFGFDQACNDASFLSEAGVPTIIWGPGDPALAHTSEERVSLADVARATQGYAMAIENLTSVRIGGHR